MAQGLPIGSVRQAWNMWSIADRGGASPRLPQGSQASNMVAARPQLARCQCHDGVAWLIQATSWRRRARAKGQAKTAIKYKVPEQRSARTGEGFMAFHAGAEPEAVSATTRPASSRQRVCPSRHGDATAIASRRSSFCRKMRLPRELVGPGFGRNNRQSAKGGRAMPCVVSCRVTARLAA